MRLLRSKVYMQALSYFKLHLRERRQIQGLRGTEQIIICLLLQHTQQYKLSLDSIRMRKSLWRNCWRCFWTCGRCSAKELPPASEDLPHMVDGVAPVSLVPSSSKDSIPMPSRLVSIDDKMGGMKDGRASLPASVRSTSSRNFVGNHGMFRSAHQWLQKFASQFKLLT